MVVATLHFSPMLPERCAVWRQLGAAAVQAAAVQRTTQCQVQGHRSAALQPAVNTTHRHHSLQESCSTATAARPELPAEKKLSFLQKNKNANLAQASSRVQNMCAKYEAADKSRRRRRVLGPEWG